MILGDTNQSHDNWYDAWSTEAQTPDINLFGPGPGCGDGYLGLGSGLVLSYVYWELGLQQPNVTQFGEESNRCDFGLVLLHSRHEAKSPFHTLQLWKAKSPT